MLKVNSNERVRWRVVVALLRRERERERELYVLGGDVLKRYEKDFQGDILMRKTRARAKKREREKQRGGFCFGKKQNDTRV